MTSPPSTDPSSRTTAAGPRCPRYLSLDFWRGVACLCIVVFHACFYVATPELLKRVTAHGGSFAEWAMAGSTWLWVGVPIFFVISGYCISATADSSRRKNAPVRLYFWRRFRRIYPPYWVFLALTVLGVAGIELYVYPKLFNDNQHGFPLPWDIHTPQWLGNVTLTETWRYHFAGPKSLLFTGHAWTLCYEEQFYAVVGLILLVSPRRFFVLAAAITLAVFVLESRPERWVPALATITRNSEGFFFDGYWLYFAAGIGVYYAINYAGRAGWWAMAGVLALAVAWGMKTHSNSRMVSFSFALLLLGLHRWDTSLATALWSRPVSWCGTMCYSLYLMHWPVTKATSHALLLAGVDSPGMTLLVTVPVCIAVSVMAAWPFHVWIERRFLNTPNLARCKTPEGATSQAQPALA